MARPATSEESVIVELRTQTTKILLKTGLASTSTSRGTIASNSKIVGRYVMLMQGMYISIIWYALIHLINSHTSWFHVIVFIITLLLLARDSMLYFSGNPCVKSNKQVELLSLNNIYTGLDAVNHQANVQMFIIVT